MLGSETPLNHLDDRPPIVSLRYINSRYTFTTNRDHSITPMSKTIAQVEQPPLDPVVATSCFEFLLIELVPLAQRMVERSHAREQAIRDEYKRSQLFHASLPTRAASTHADTTEAQTDNASSIPDSTRDTNADTTTLAGVVGDEVRDSLLWKLDQMGYRVGQGLVERYGHKSMVSQC